MKRNVVLDCDPGHDDAVAILLAGKSDKINLLGISTASGNQTIEKTTRNTVNICRYLGIDVPIAKGSCRPLVQKSMICPEVHGESGLDGFDFPEYDQTIDSRSGAQLIIDCVMNNDDVTVVTTGPMTNLGLAMRLEPKIIQRIKEVIFMGGSIDHGNVSPAAEFNILVDPEAAYIVATSGVPIKMVGLNVTRQVAVDDDIIERMRKVNNKASKMFCDLMRVFLDNQRKTFGVKVAPLHDPVTIASILDDTCVKFEKMNLEIDISHGPSYGRTNCDVFDYMKAPKNCDVAVGIDQKKFWDIIENGLKEY